MVLWMGVGCCLTLAGTSLRKEEEGWYLPHEIPVCVNGRRLVDAGDLGGAAKWQMPGLCWEEVKSALGGEEAMVRLVVGECRAR
jgi:hypothetical protein